jgi:hypothetical protein
MNCPRCGFDGLSPEARFCRKCGFEIKGSGEAEGKPPSGRRSTFLEFQIRAWLTDPKQVQVLVHSSPVGDMRKPETVSVDPDKIRSVRDAGGDIGMKDHSYSRAIEIGRSLAKILLPPPVLILLIRSLEHIEPPDGLRLRLCLDEHLVDLPWEMLYRPDEQENSLAGFLALDPRISLVREAPISRERPRESLDRERLVYVGALYPLGDSQDSWGVQAEQQDLFKVVGPLESFLEMDAEFHAASQENIRNLLERPASFFHYSGHVLVEGVRGSIVCEMGRNSHPIDLLGSDQLASMLWKANTRVAVFNACNSGAWNFVKPLLRQAGLTALFGVQGVVEVRASQAFVQKLYSHLALGLSLDEAVTAARLHLLEPGVSPLQESCAWGVYMVYMPSTTTIPFPKPEDQAVLPYQQAAREERTKLINNYYNIVQNIGTIEPGGSATGVKEDS